MKIFIKTLKVVFGIIIPLIIVAYIVTYTSLFISSVETQVNRVNQNKHNSDSMRVSSETFDLIRQKAFLAARLNMSDADSVGMSINLGDSVMQLEMKGVVLHEIKFSQFTYSKFFHSIHPDIYAKIFSHPFKVSKIDGTIVKEPLKVKIAPKDTIEAAAQVSSAANDSAKVEFVEWHMMLDDLILVNIVQTGNEEGKNDWPTVKYRLDRQIETLKTGFKNTLRFQKSDYYPEITIYIPKEEAKSFYRALALKGMVVLKI